MAEPKKKKAKNEIDRSSVFLDFLKQDLVVESIKEVTDIIDDYTNVKLLKIYEANARATENFNRATCKTDVYMRPEDQNTLLCYSFGSFFSNGTETLLRYIQEQEIPRDSAPRIALEKLLHFLKSSLTSIRMPHRDIKGSKWAVQLAQHLFSQLSIDGEFTIDKRYKNKEDRLQNTCPCGEGDKLTGEFGDTSFGCPDAWYGSVDIYLENVTVQVASDEDYSDDITKGTFLSDSSDCGNDKYGGNLKDPSDKMLAQCIVFSFLQRKQHRGGIGENTLLVPSIGVDRSGLIITFYDSKNDVLLQSAKLCLFYNENLNIKMVVCVWLAMNYRFFCTGITDEMKVYKANFHNHVGDCLEKYEHNVKRPVDGVSQRSSYVNWEDRKPKKSKNPVTMKFVSLKEIDTVALQ